MGSTMISAEQKIHFELPGFAILFPITISIIRVAIPNNTIMRRTVGS
jgi:hypothetical protein